MTVGAVGQAAVGASKIAAPALDEPCGKPPPVLQRAGRGEETHAPVLRRGCRKRRNWHARTVSCTASVRFRSRLHHPAGW